VSVPVVAFFNNKGGVGKTSLVYHLAWTFQDLGTSVLVADLDPQANLTAAFLDEDRLDELWPNDAPHATIYGAIEPQVKGVGDILDEPFVESIDESLHLLAGDLALARFEDELSLQWPLCLSGNERAFRVESAFWRIMQRAALRVDAAFVLVDMGPNLGAINRAALLACDALVVPLAPDLFSLQGLRNLGPTVKVWRREWQDRLQRAPVLPLPAGAIKPLGYVLMQHAERLDRPTRAYQRWAERIPFEYAEQFEEANSPRQLGLVKHYRSLMPMAQEARKPMFHLTAADGAMGAHVNNVRTAAKNFREIADALVERIGL